jgi:hypothetical protein
VITGRKPEDCFKSFREHLAPVLAGTLDEACYLDLTAKKGEQFRRTMQAGHEGLLRLQTRSHGTIGFHVAQDLEALPLDGGGFRLRTRHYWYKIFGSEAAGLVQEPALRWDYVAQPPVGEKWCRHHFQIGKVLGEQRTPAQAVQLPLGADTLNLNKLHMPTGFVLIEYIIRFLITELGVKPPCGDDRWEEVLHSSEQKFFSEFSPKTSSPKTSGS